MATFDFTILNSSVALANIDGFGFYKPRNMVPVISGSIITFKHPKNINYDFSISTSDTITAAGNPVTGTAEEIADALAGAIFFEPSGGGSFDASEPLVLTSGSLDVAKDQAGATDVLIENYADTDGSSRLGVYCNNAGVDLRVTDNTGIVEMWVSYGNGLNFKVTGAPLSFDAPSFKYTLASIGNYADDTAAAAGGVAIGQKYRTGSILKIRVA